MVHVVKNRFRHLTVPLLMLVLAASMFPHLALGQAQPTAEQMRMINSLPPAQRQQALQALEAYRNQGNVSGGSMAPVTEEEPEFPNANLVLPMPEEKTELEPRVRANSRLVVTLTIKESLTQAERSDIEKDPVVSRLEGSHHFVLDDSGALSLLGLKDIPLLGLTESDIAERLLAEPMLEPFDIRVRILDIELTGIEALEPFGYDLFKGADVSFDPVLTGPVPSDYVLGPGDSIRVQLFGNVTGIYEFDVTRDGILNLPELGPITVSGLPFSEFRQDLKNRVDEMLIGTQISVTMGQLRKIRIFVLGDASRPGSYVVSSLATMSSALYRSGGISPIGSMRNIQLKRQGETVATLDLYDLLLRGDTSSDLRLQPGDVLFVPPIGETVGVGGEVKRPAIYEMQPNATSGDAIAIAGGMSADAFPEAARLERIDTSRQRIVLSVNLLASTGLREPVKGGDTLIVPRVLPDLQASVILSGHVQRPGPYQWRPGMRLTDLLPGAMDLLPGADASYVLIRRLDPVDRSIEVVSADLGAAFQNPSGADNKSLQVRDTVHVFSLVFGRQLVIQPILDELKLQARYGAPYNEVNVAGFVRAPGAYPLEPGMRISDLIRAGGDMVEGAYGVEAELTRYSVVDGEYRTTEILDVDLDAVMAGDQAANILLSAHDHLTISLVPDWDSTWSVRLEGEVRFPGEYQIRRGETLTDVLERAGGLNDQAFPEGAIFLRESLREREREQLEVLARRMESDLATLSLESLDTNGAEALSTGQALLDQLRNTEPVGRLVIDIEQITSRVDSGRIVRDIELRDGDRLLIPNRSQEVTVLGEIQYATSHLYQPGLARNDYIALSGGLTRKADEKLIYVVRASGAVISSNRSKWFGRGQTMEIRPGDTIVVPLETDRIRPLTFWTSVTQILYQGAIAVAAVKTFNN